MDNYVKDNTFIIGILGHSPIKEPLEEIARTKKVNNNKIVIKQFNKPQDIRFCNILFISKRSDYLLDDVLPLLPVGTLTVSEEYGMAEDGSAINFIIRDNKLKFEANLRAIDDAGLKATSELLQHAVIVNQ